MGMNRGSHVLAEVRKPGEVGDPEAGHHDERQRQENVPDSPIDPFHRIRQGDAGGHMRYMICIAVALSPAGSGARSATSSMCGCAPP